MVLEALPLLKSTYHFTAIACLLAGVLAGCDTQEGEGAQGGAEISDESETHAFTGFIDRTYAGRSIPEVELVDPAGITLALAETGGMPVLLNLWATWCAPCVVEMPLLDEVAAEFGPNLRVLTVSEDIQGADKVVPFFETHGFTNLPRWMDPQNDLAFSFGGGGALPLTILYDADGREVWRVIGAYDWSSDEARALVAEAGGGDG
jgi:thiol-disulfide isomerase/thioredoxin